VDDHMDRHSVPKRGLHAGPVTSILKELSGGSSEPQIPRLGLKSSLGMTIHNGQQGRRPEGRLYHPTDLSQLNSIRILRLSRLELRRAPPSDSFFRELMLACTGMSRASLSAPPISAEEIG